jgi:hypothetical protein
VSTPHTSPLLFQNIAIKYVISLILVLHQLHIIAAIITCNKNLNQLPKINMNLNVPSHAGVTSELKLFEVALCVTLGKYLLLLKCVF